MLAGSITRSTRGRCGGRCPRLRAGLRGVSAPFPRSALSAFSCAASSTPWANSASSSGRLNWSGDSFSERLPNFSRCAVREACLRADDWPPAPRPAPPRPRQVGLSAGRFRVQDQRHPWNKVNHETRHFSSKNGDFGALSDHPAASGRRACSGRTNRQSSPSNKAASCAEDIRITPSRICGQTNLLPSSRL